jgi:hypothetical protein
VQQQQQLETDEQFVNQCARLAGGRDLTDAANRAEWTDHNLFQWLDLQCSGIGTGESKSQARALLVFSLWVFVR